MRPIGVLLVAAFLILEGFANILIGAGMILAKEDFYEVMKEEFGKIIRELNATHIVDYEEVFDTVYEVASFATIFIGILYIIVAIGVFALKNWARYLAIVLLVFQFTYSLVTVYIDPSSILGVVISIALLWYLFRKDVKEMFLGKKTTIEERILGEKI
ncbi:MAG: hypothetical protein ACK401_02250 [Archaeoglobaceae archaeon]